MTTATTADNIFQQQVNGGGGVESESQTAATAEALGIAAAACVTVKRTSSSRRTFHFTPPSSYRLMALMRKNLIQTFRNIGYTKKKKNDSRARFLSFFKNFPFFFPPTFSVFIFVFLLPVIQAILFCMAIGHDPTSLKLAVVNEELDASQGREYCNYTTACTYSMYSCRYLRFINNETIIQVNTPSNTR